MQTPSLCGTASRCETRVSFSIQLLTKNSARRFKVAHARRRRCWARPYAGTKIDNVPSDTGAYLAYLLLPVCSVMASAAGIFTACVPATFVVAAKSRADQGLAKACAETKIDNVPGDTGARSSTIYHDAYKILAAKTFDFVSCRPASDSLVCKVSMRRAVHQHHFSRSSRSIEHSG